MTDLNLSHEEARQVLLDLNNPVYVMRRDEKLMFSNQPVTSAAMGETLAGFMGPMPLERLGDDSFRKCYGTRYAYYGGAMANAISSEAMVIALSKAGFLGSFGAAGMDGDRLEAVVLRIRQALGDGPCAYNLIHNPNEPAMERAAVDVFLKHGVRIVEASAFLDLTTAIVHYRAAGLSLKSDGSILIQNHVIAKISRKEVAQKFMQPAPIALLNQLVAEGRLTSQQVELAQRVPMADDVTVEADSGGHTDNRPLVCLLPTMMALRDELQMRYQFSQPVRVGAGGGISTPASALAAFMMGAAYVVTGSVNQACVESGTSEHVKKLLAQAGMADVIMAPSADMFEIGAKVQLLKLGTLFPMRAQKLYELYTRYNSIDEIPVDERDKLERQVFKRSIEDVWQETVRFFNARDPQQITRAQENPKRKMALVFRWYLGLASRWAVSGEKGREMDYQIWCGPAMGTFNDWARHTYLETPENRHVVDVAAQILTGAAYLYRTQSLKMQGIALPPEIEHYHATAPLL